MRKNGDPLPRSFDLATEPLRRRILEYIAQAGGEVRSDSGHRVQRQICDALAERPARVSQALIGLERGGLLEREMDLERHRCQAIRLVSRRAASRPKADRQRNTAFVSGDGIERLLSQREERAGPQAELEAAERELSELIRRAAEVSRRVAKLRWAVVQARSAPAPPASTPPPDLHDQNRDSEHAWSR